MVQASLKTLSPSPIIKISNVHDRKLPLSQELQEELHDDMTGEITKADVSDTKRVKIVTEEEQRLGAETGSVFCEFRDKKDAQKALIKLKGRIYDGRQIKVCFIDETLYYSELYIK